MILEPDDDEVYGGKYYPVCEKCLVIALRVREGHSTYSRCPICGNGDTQFSNKDMGWTQQWVEDNYEFYLFTRGIDYASFSGGPNQTN